MKKNARLQAVTANHVRKAAKKLGPGSVQKWGVEIDGDEYAVRPLMMEAANLVESSEPLLTPADYNTHRYVRRFEQIGFRTKYHG